MLEWKYDDNFDLKIYLLVAIEVFFLEVSRKNTNSHNMYVSYESSPILW